SPPAAVASACHVWKLVLAVRRRTLPSHSATLTTVPTLRGPERPPAPPQSTSGRSSLNLRVAVKVPCRKRPSLQEAQRSALMFLSFFQSSTPDFSVRFFRSSFFSPTCWRHTSVAFIPPSPRRVSIAIAVLLVPSVMLTKVSFEFR